MNNDLMAASQTPGCAASDAHSVDAQKQPPPTTTELPLFAAAELIQQRNQRKRRLLLTLVVCALLVAGYFIQPLFGLWQQTLAPNEPLKVTSKPVIALEVTTEVPAVVAAKPDEPVDALLPAVASQSQAVKTKKPVEQPVSASDEAVTIEQVHVEPAQTTIVSLDLDANQAGVVSSQTASAALMKSTPVESTRERDRKTANRASQMLAGGQHAQASILLQQALKINPAWHQSRRQYINALIVSGEHDKAQSQLNTYRAYSQNKSELDNLQARILIAQADYRAAINLLASTAGEQFEADRWALLGSAYQSAGLWAEAATSYSTLLAHDRSQPRWWLGLAVAYDALNQEQEARQAYIEALRYGQSLEPQLQNYAKSRLASL